MFTQQAITVLVYLLPGFLCMSLLDILTPSRRRLNIQYFVNALMFSLIIYVIYSTIFDEIPVLMIEKVVNNEKQYTLRFASGSLWVLVIVSILPSVLLSLSIKYDLHMRLFRKLGITNRTSQISLWIDVFTNIQRYVVVSLTDGKRLYGWPEFFGDDPEEKSLFLAHPSWIDDENKYHDLNVRGILFPSAENIETITFLQEAKD